MNDIIFQFLGLRISGILSLGTSLIKSSGDTTDNEKAPDTLCASELIHEFFCVSKLLPYKVHL